MPEVLSEYLVEKMQNIWGRMTVTDLPAPYGQKFLRYGIEDVEGIDFPQGNSFTVGENSVIAFVAVPALASQVLYVWKALVLLEKSEEGRLLLDGGGVIWKDGINTIGTEGVATSHRQRKKDFAEEYKIRLELAKINDLDESAYSIDLYETEE